MTPARDWWSALGFARRQLVRSTKSPALALPPVLFPLMLFGAFVGGLSALGRAPNFNYPNYTTFQFVWVLMVGVALTGTATGLSLAGDFETGFSRRMLLATARRWPIALGYVLSSVVRAVVVGALLFGVGLVAGMEVSGTALDVIGVIGLALFFNLIVTLWSIAVALRVKSLQSAPLMQTPVFIAVFLVPVYTTRSLLTSWVHTAANGNPFTPVIEAGRGLIVGEPTRVGVAFGISIGVTLALSVLVLASLRGLEKPPEPRRAKGRRRAPGRSRPAQA